MRLHPLGFTMYPAITGHGIPRPNEEVYNQALLFIQPLLVKGFLRIVIFPDTTPLKFDTI